MVEFKQTHIVLSDAVGNSKRITLNGFWKRETVLRKINSIGFGRFATVKHVTILPNATRRTEISEEAYHFVSNPTRTGGYLYA